jgi:Uma2 family endonuclease
MASGTTPKKRKKLASVKTLADLVARLGNIPLERVRFYPLLGTATERDVLAARREPERRLCELVDGVLVEKPMGTYEALVAGLLLYHFWAFLETHDLGIPIGADGMVRLWRGLVRIPDVAFYSWDDLPNGELPDEAIATIVPTLAVEVLSPSNTKAEIDRKLHEYFKAGAKLAWIIDPESETAEVYTSPTQSSRVARSGKLDGGAVLPGFSLSLKKLFAYRPRRKPRS